MSERSSDECGRRRLASVREAEDAKAALEQNRAEVTLAAGREYEVELVTQKRGRRAA